MERWPGILRPRSSLLSRRVQFRHPVVQRCAAELRSGVQRGLVSEHLYVTLLIYSLSLSFSHRAGIEPLIDTDDMIFMGSRPDAKVVFTYVQSLYRHLSRRQLPAMMRERW